MISEIQQEALEQVPALSYNVDEEVFTINFSDVDDVYDSYMRSPIVNTFIKYEILIRRSVAHEKNYSNISRYEVLGFIYDERGESYEVTKEWVDQCREWINDEF